MRVRYAVTFEFETRPPVTARGIVEAAGAATCVRRATQSAQRELRPVGWSSVCAVLLERLPEACEAATDAEGAIAPGAPAEDAR